MKEHKKEKKDKKDKKPKKHKQKSRDRSDSRPNSERDRSRKEKKVKKEKKSHGHEHHDRNYKDRDSHENYRYQKDVKYEEKRGGREEEVWDQRQENEGWEIEEEPINQIKQESIKKQNEGNKQQGQGEGEGQEQQKEMPNFEPSGILLEYYNSRDGVSLKFHEPREAHKPIDEWRIYPFKDKNPLNPIILKQSCYLIGKDQRICDILCENPSISRQHAVIQFREIHKMQLDGTYTSEVKPYLLDLESTNGTFVNDEKIEASRYVELLAKDILKFGLSDRQYVMFKVPTNQL